MSFLSVVFGIALILMFFLPNMPLKIFSLSTDVWSLACGILFVSIVIIWHRTDEGTELLEAAKYGRTDEVMRLLPLNPDVNIPNWYGETALIKASAKGYTEIVKALLAIPSINVNHANVSLYDRLNLLDISPLHKHILTSTTATIINTRVAAPPYKWRGATALIRASNNGHTETVSLLLAFPGINVNHIAVSIYH